MKKLYLGIVLVVFLLPTSVLGYEQSVYTAPPSIGRAGVGGELRMEYERKLFPHYSFAAQLYGRTAFAPDLWNSSDEKGYSLLGIGAVVRWYFKGEVFSGTYLGLGASIKRFSIKHFISDKLAEEGEGTFYLPFLECGWIRTWSEYMRYGLYFLAEYAIERSVSGIARQETGWQYSLIFKFGASIKDPEWVKL